MDRLAASSRMPRRADRLVSAVTLAAIGFGAPAPSSAQGWLGFRSTIGHEWLTGGDLSAPLDGDTRSDWSVFLRPPPITSALQVYVGAGISRITYTQNPTFPVQAPVPVANTHGDRWNHVSWHALLGVEITASSWLAVYLERRRAWGRLRSQTHLFWDITDDPPRFTPYRDWAVQGLEMVWGLRSDLGFLPVRLDVQYRRGDLQPRGASNFDMSAYGLGVRQHADIQGLQIGAHWTP